MKRPVIGVMGASRCGPEVSRLAYEVGRAVAKGGGTLLCGGLSGVMEEAARGAKEAGGFTVGILPGRDAEESPPNPHIDLPIYTGMGDARNVVNVLSSDALVAVSGGSGTLSEIALAMKAGKPVVLLGSWRLSPPEGRLPDNVREARSPEEAVRTAFELAQAPRRARGRGSRRDR